MAEEMTVPGDAHARLEGRVTVLEATVEREAALRAKMDEDQSNITATLKVHGRLLQALHDTQQDHTQRLTRMEGDLGDVKEDLRTVKEDLGTVKERLGTVEEGLGTVKIGVHAILDLLDTHLARQPRRLSLAGLLGRAQ
jgi:hypothetical protein